MPNQYTAGWTEEEIQFLRDNARKMTYAEIGKNLGRSEKSVNIKASNLGINGGNYTEEENDFIEEHAPTRTIQWIAQQLNRPIHGLRAHMIKLGVGDLHMESGTYSASALAEAIGVSHETVRRWVNEKGLVGRKKSRYTGVNRRNMHYHIAAEDFWRWAAKNKDLVEFNKFEKNALPPEPNWVQEERKKQFYNPPKQRIWTPEEDERAWELYYKGLKQREIAEEMGRTQNSVERRLKRLREAKLNAKTATKS